VQERFLRLTALQDRIAHEENQAQVGRTVEVLVAEAEGRKDGATHRVTGRAADNRLVHLALPDGGDVPRPGDLVSVTVTHAAPNHLVADSALTGGTFTVRRTAAGDAWDRRQNGQDEHSHGGAGDSCGTGGPAGPVVLGLPTIGLARR
jgi:tRNA-2-methylthio-N6-dimethylallyladenosine synthase